MKLLLLLIVMYPISGFADPVVTTKIHDGTTVYCENKADAYSLRFQAYTIKSVSVTQNKSSELMLNLKLEMLECSKIDGIYQFSKTNPLDDINYKVLSFDDNNNSYWNHVTAKTSSFSALVFKDAVYKALFSKKLNIKSNTLSFNIKLKELLSEGELSDLKSNKIVKTDFDFSLRRFLTLNSESHSGHKYPVRYGSFRFHLQLENRKEGIKVSRF